MLNRTPNSSLRAMVALAGITAAGTVPQAAPLTLSNATTEVVVYGGESNSDLVDFSGYFDYTDIDAGELVTWSVDPVVIDPTGVVYVLSNGSAGGFGSPMDLGGGIIRSTADIPGVMSIQADTELIGSNARTVFTFTPADDNAPPVGYQFLFYTENDLFDFANDSTAFTGSIAGGDLALFQYDSGLDGLTVRLTGDAGAGTELVAFGSEIWPAWGAALELGDLSSLSGDGSTFEAGPADLGLALLFDLLFASPATLTINFDTQPNPPGVPEPTSLALFGLGFTAFACARRARGKSTPQR